MPTTQDMKAQGVRIRCVCLRVRDVAPTMTTKPALGPAPRARGVRGAAPHSALDSIDAHDA